jgi:hypothetical protein
MCYEWLFDPFSYFGGVEFDEETQTAKPANPIPETPEGAFVCNSAAEVRLCSSPWVSGTRALRYAGGAQEVKLTGCSLDDAFYLLDVAMQEKAFYLNCNAVVGYECHLHLWEEPMVAIGKGTCAILGPV